MKKVLLILVLLIFAVATPAKASVTSLQTVSGAAYYSAADDSWSRTPVKDAIKVVIKNDTVYKNEKEFFKLPGNIRFIEANKLVSFDSKTLKYYTVSYSNKQFGQKQMSAEEVQKIFPKVKVLPTSKFIGGVIYTTKAPYEEKMYLIVNDADGNYANYRFSPVGIQRGPLNGCFTITRSRDIRFAENGDLAQSANKLKVKIRIDNSLETPAVHTRIPARVTH